MANEHESYAAAIEARLFSANSLADHMQQLHRRSRGGSRWLAVAVFFGAAIAGGFVIFFAR
jgi:hypothetical protein